MQETSMLDLVESLSNLEITTAIWNKPRCKRCHTHMTEILLPDEEEEIISVFKCQTCGHTIYATSL